MARLLTCTGCKLAGQCAKADGMRASLKGLGVRTVKFACKERQSIFSPGQPVIFSTFESYEDQTVPVDYPGYVIEQMGGKVFGFIKPGTDDLGDYEIPFEPKAGGFVKMPLKRVTADTSRPFAGVELCAWCGQYPGIGVPCGKDPHYTPAAMCLAEAGAPPPPPPTCSPMQGGDDG